MSVTEQHYDETAWKNTFPALLDNCGATYLPIYSETCNLR